jgi:glucose-6-phosphate dehydrogenase assembly protein OpcA
MKNSSPVVALAEPQKVQIAQVNKQLSKIWSAKNDSGATRASTFNLLVFQPEMAGADEIPAYVGAIAVQHPCRAIVLSAASDVPESSLEALVAAYCPISEAGAQESICCEYVTLRASGQALQELHTTVSSLLLPELETFLWWQAPIAPHMQLFTNLQGIVDRTIIDSLLLETPDESLLNFSELALGSKESHSFGDLNWSRLTPWREEAALAFDTEERFKCLGSIDQVVIEYGQGSGESVNPSQAYLLLGWFAGRLGWTPLSLHSKQGLRQLILTDREQRPIQASLKAVPTEAHLNGRITSIGLRSSDQGSACSTVLCSEDASSCVRVQTVIGEANVSHITALTDLNTEELLAEALQAPDHDLIYEEALEAVHAMLSLLK